MDLSMPGLDGVAATRRLTAEHPEVRVVVLSSFTDSARVRDAVAAGAVGYVLKDSGPDEVLAAVRTAAGGHSPFDPRVASALLPGRAVIAGPQLSERPRCCGWPAGAWPTSRSAGRWGSASGP